LPKRYCIEPELFEIFWEAQSDIVCAPVGQEKTTRSSALQSVGADAAVAAQGQVEIANIVAVLKSVRTCMTDFQSDRNDYL
jgi:hypothetical protein